MKSLGGCGLESVWLHTLAPALQSFAHCNALIGSGFATKLGSSTTAWLRQVVLCNYGAN